MKNILLSLVILLPAQAVLAQVNTITVETQEDELLASDGACSLREALVNANLVAGGDESGGNCEPGVAGLDRIVVPAGTFAIIHNPDGIAWGEDEGLQGDLDVLEPLEVVGAGMDQTILQALEIDAQAYQQDRIFDAFADLTLSGMTMAGGRVDHQPDWMGGGIRVTGAVALDLEAVKVRGSRAQRGGGIDAREGTVEIRNSAIEGNRATAGGGGIQTVGPTTLVNTSLNDNVLNGGSSGRVRGGGISGNDLTIIGGSILRNKCLNAGTGRCDGGGVNVGHYGAGGSITARLVIQDAVISDNESKSTGGGVIGLVLSATITGSTFSGNSARDGGGGIISGDIVFSSNDVNGNSADSYYGGFSLSTHTSALTGSILVAESQFRNNSALGSIGGLDLGGGQVGGTSTASGLLIDGNTASVSGGLVVAGRGITLSDITIKDNRATTDGAGMRVGVQPGVADGLVIATDLIVEGNSSDDHGAGIFVDGPLSISRSVISNNIAGYADAVGNGGGIYVASGGDLSISNSTVTGNEASPTGTGGDGGGIYAAANSATKVFSVTITQNSAPSSGGGIQSHDDNGIITLKNSIIHGNSGNNSGPNCKGLFISEGFNIVPNDDACILQNQQPTDVIGADPGLISLADNGGPTRTHSFADSSPAVNAGTCLDISGQEILFDQRNVARPGDPQCDVGAFELESANVTPNEVVAFLSGANEQPAVMSAGEGQVSGTLEGSQFTVAGTFGNLEGTVTAAHVHSGEAGQLGSVVIPLTVTPNSGGRGGTLSAVADVSGIGNFAATLDAGGYYINVHSSTRGSGELRGQLLSTERGAPGPATLGSQADVVIAGSAGDPGLNWAWTPGSFSPTPIVNWVEVSASPSFTDAHFQTYLEGTDNLTQTMGELASLYERQTGGSEVGGSMTAYFRIVSSDGSRWTRGAAMALTLTRGVLTEVAEKSGKHAGTTPDFSGTQAPSEPTYGFSPASPSATDRGSTLSGVFSGSLTPGSGVVGASLDGGTLTLSGNFANLSSQFTAAHIHAAANGSNGGVVLPISPTLTPEGRGGTFAGTYDVSGVADFEGLLASGQLYLNVHTVAFPSGEIRGQLLADPNAPPPATTVNRPSDVLIVGESSETLFSVSWLPVTDPDGDFVTYQYEIGIDPAFSRIPVSEQLHDGNGLSLSVADAAGLFADLGGEPGGIIVGYQRVVVSDGGSRTVGPSTQMSLTHPVRVTEQFDKLTDEGWNMVGMPFQDPVLLADAFPTALDGSFFGFAGSYQAPDPAQFELGRGYWLRFPTAGVAILSGAPASAVTVSLNSGWNMFSGPFCSMPVAGIDDPAGILLAGTAFGFSGSYVLADYLAPGAGYWIRASAAGQVTLDCSAATKGASSSEPLASFSRVDLEDSRGNRQTVYLGGRLPQGTAPFTFTAPPTAPGARFRATFPGERFVAEEQRAQLALVGAAFPVQLSAQGALSAEVLAGTEVIGALATGPGGTLLVEDSRTTALRLSTGSQASDVPEIFALEQNYPNPFNPVTTIRFGLPEAGPVTLTVFDALGRPVGELLRSENRNAGWHTITFDARHLTSGTYFYRIQAGSQSRVQRMVLMK